ncbi:SDR family oxidoreductase [Candidatus Woesearchaeota archaeon]|nr:SDR family oxidoreductase [Candidatus Woesearchaeota archaeon]
MTEQLKTLKDKNCVVTGGAQGIGKALCAKLVREGANVFSLDINVPNKSDAIKGVTYLEADVTDSKALIKAFEKLDQIGVLYNNAGIIRRGRLLDISEQEFDMLFNVNVKGFWLVLKTAAPKLTKGATIVFMSSRHGLNLPADPGAYAVTKQANIGLAEVFHKGYPGYDVKILCPGSIDTALGRHQVSDKEISMKEKIMNAPEFLADKIVDLTLSDKKWLLFDEESSQYSTALYKDL